MAGRTPGGVPPDLAQWRKVMREELIARRLAVTPDQRRDWSLAISLMLLRALPLREGLTLGYCWPYKGEYDPRPFLRLVRERGMRCALPVVKRREEPLIFRFWKPGVAMKIGTLGIAYPADTEQVQPDLLLVPLVGFGRAGDRLGYGGGYFDRTLAALEPCPLAVGVGFELCQIESTFPQAHDILMDAVVTERAMRWQNNGKLEDVTAQDLREKLTDLALVREQNARMNAHTVPAVDP